MCVFLFLLDLRIITILFSNIFGVHLAPFKLIKILENFLLVGVNLLPELKTAPHQFLSFLLDLQRAHVLFVKSLLHFLLFVLIRPFLLLNIEVFILSFQERLELFFLEPSLVRELSLYIKSCRTNLLFFVLLLYLEKVEFLLHLMLDVELFFFFVIHFVSLHG